MGHTGCLPHTGALQGCDDVHDVPLLVFLQIVPYVTLGVRKKLVVLVCLLWRQLRGGT